ncbi:MAG TPA: hypothetical protein VL346_00550 [Acidobacteriaceae bacterium]|nr:hypothetical protein [Acidobacteriaceae bacterium]
MLRPANLSLCLLLLFAFSSNAQTASSKAQNAYSKIDILQHHNDVARTGANLQETQLTTANVKPGSFGKLASRPVDGNPYAQPLVITRAAAEGRSQTDIVIVATEHNSVYAFDANDTDPDSSRAQLWRAGPDRLGEPIDTNQLYSDLKVQTCADISTEIGITGTPAIQLTRAKAPKEGVVYVAAKSKSGGVYSYTLFALRLADGAELSRTLIRGQAAGTGVGSRVVRGRHVIPFQAEYEFNRAALLLHGNTLYITFGGHCDKGPYHGWIFAYDVSSPENPRQIAVFCDTPDGRGTESEGRGGIWMSGEGPSLDADGNLYLATGDGSYNGLSDFGDSVLKLRLEKGALRSHIHVRDWFTPTNQKFLKENDVDLGSGGVVLLPGTHLMLIGGKEGRIFLLDQNNLGRGKSPPLAMVQVTHPHDGPQFYNLHGTPALWPRKGETFVYVSGEENPFNQYRLIPDASAAEGAGWRFDSGETPYRSTSNCGAKSNCLFSPYPNAPEGLFGRLHRDDVWMPGGFLTLSADGEKAGTGILWVSMPYADNANHAVVRGVLRALDAADISRPELWNSESTGDAKDQLGFFAKFCPPTVANGKVYVSTFKEEIVLQNGLHLAAPPPGKSAALVIYGLKPQHAP